MPKEIRLQRGHFLIAANHYSRLATASLDKIAQQGSVEILNAWRTAMWGIDLGQGNIVFAGRFESFALGLLQCRDRNRPPVEKVAPSDGDQVGVACFFRLRYETH